MLPNERDIKVVEKIVAYCEDINSLVCRFGDSIESFSNDMGYKYSTTMCILQIGELVGILSEEFKNLHTEIPWQQIKSMRNVMAHKYGNISPSQTWQTIKEDIPFLKEYCINILKT